MLQIHCQARKRRNQVLGGAMILALALSAGTHAQAADLAAPKGWIAAPAAPLAYDWTGFYVGAHGGFVRGHDLVNEFFTPTGAYLGLQHPYSTSGGVGGVHAGANYQYGPAVLGIVADIEASSLKGGFTDPAVLPVNPGGIGTAAVSGQGSVRGKLGFAYDRFQLYATGGLALVNLKYSYFNPSANLGETTTQIRNGWTVGVGAEYAFTDNLIASVEYRHTKISKFFYDSKVAYPGLITAQQVPRFNMVNFGLSYKF